MTNVDLKDVQGKVLSCMYVNYRGEVSPRAFKVIAVKFGFNDYHQEPQFLIEGTDIIRGTVRTYAVNDMSLVRVHEPYESAVDIITSVEERHLGGDKNV